MKPEELLAVVQGRGARAGGPGALVPPVLQVLLYNPYSLLYLHYRLLSVTCWP